MTKITPGMIAVVSGGGAGMGRQLCIHLCRLGVRVATCDVHDDKLQETVAECKVAAPSSDVFTFTCDVSKEDQCVSFKNATLLHFSTTHVNLLFNNAGISGGSSFVAGPRDDWDACFNVCWFGVYYMSRVFMQSLVASASGHIVNTSSVNGFWATIGPQTPHTAYSTAKFAVKGFTEALLTDMRMHAPQIGVTLVCPGHIGTDIAINSMQQALDLQGDAYLEKTKQRMLANRNIPSMMKERLKTAGKDEILMIVEMIGNQFRNTGMPASDAAEYILNAVQAGQWRVMVGDDAEVLDEAIRKDPASAYGRKFWRWANEHAFSPEGGNSNLRKQKEHLGLLQPSGMVSKL